MRLSPALYIGPLAVVILAACGDKEPPGSSGGALPPPVTTTTATATANATATASASAPAPDALPATDPPTVHTSTAAATAAPAASATASAKPNASAKPDAGAKPPKVAATAAPDAGAADAGAVAMIDAGAAASPALAIAQQVDTIFAAKKTFVADFTQTYTIKATGTTKTSNGQVFIERPSKISFRYNPPNQNRIVSDGVTIKVYMADDKQMIETPAQNTAYPGALAFMMGNGISQSFDFAINTKAQWSGGVILDGKPLSPNPSYDLAMFYIDQSLLQKSDPNAIKRVLVVDAQGNRNRFDFTNVAQPASIPPSEFTFTPPPGTDIKRQ